MTTQHIAIVNEILSLLGGAAGQEHYGEGVTQLEHALQCADLAMATGSDDQTVIAALLHDIGHLCAPDAPHMGAMGAVDHEALGAAYLAERGFSPKVVALVGSHVAAKRYLVAVDQEYAQRLSAASTATLRHQGGPMSTEEVAEFAADPLMRLKLQLRAWDDMGKQDNRTASSLDSFRSLLVRHLEEQSAA